MKVYSAAARHRQGSHEVHVAPAAHLDHAGLPADWINERGQPVNMTVTFRDGVAEVTPELGRYLLSQRLARKSSLILPSLVA